MLFSTLYGGTVLNPKPNDSSYVKRVNAHRQYKDSTLLSTLLIGIFTTAHSLKLNYK